MSASGSTADKLQRLISIVSWIAAHDGPTVVEVCDRFAIGEDELLAQLEMASMVGGDSTEYGDMPIESYSEDGRVWVHLFAFHRPLQLTPAQALTLLAAGAGWREVEGDGADTPLDRALAKLAAVLGIDPEEVVDVDLGRADADVLEQLRAAARDHHQVELDYWSAGRDQRTRRIVDPWRVFSHDGAWYLQANCRSAGGHRVFRIDRVRALQPLDTSFKPPQRLPDATSFTALTDDPRVVLELEPDVRWVAQAYPVEAVEDLGQGRVRVTMAVSQRSWLGLLLVRLGPHVRVTSIDERLGGSDLAAETATRILARYATD